MEPFTVIAKKGKGGWEAENRFDFLGARRLSIKTYKMTGLLVTYASVNKYYDGGYQHAFGLGSGGDFSERVFANPVRATGQSVSEQQGKALVMVEEILARARAHYAKYPPRD